MSKPQIVYYDPVKAGELKADSPLAKRMGYGMPTNAPAQELSKTLGISFGALSDSLAKQIRDQDLEIDPTKCGHLQLDIDAVNRLRIRGALTDSEAHKVHKRLMKAITNAVQEGRINA